MMVTFVDMFWSPEMGRREDGKTRKRENGKTRRRENGKTRRRENEKTRKRENEKTRKRENEKTEWTLLTPAQTKSKNLEPWTLNLEPDPAPWILYSNLTLTLTLTLTFTLTLNLDLTPLYTED